MNGARTGAGIDMSLWGIGTRDDLVIGVPAAAMLGVGVDMLDDAEIIVVVIAAVNRFKCTIWLTSAVEVLYDAWSGAIPGGKSGVGAEMNASGLAMTTASEFALSTLLEESSRC